MLDRLYENIMCSFNLACNIKDAREISERINIQTIYSSSFLIYRIIMGSVRLDLREVVKTKKSDGPILNSRPVATFSVGRFKSLSGEEGIDVFIRGGNIDEFYSLSEDEFYMSSVDRMHRKKVKKMLSYFEFNQETLALLNDTIEKLNIEIV